MEASRWRRTVGLVSLALLSGAKAKTVRAGLIEGYKQDFKFVEKFAFAATTLEEPGTIELRAWTFMPGQQMLVYENEAWFDAYTGDASGACESRYDRSTMNATMEKGKFYGEAGKVLEIPNVVQDSPSFWFLALSRCQSWVRGWNGDSCMGERTGAEMPNGLFMYYELILLNPGGYWRKHFSYDEQGLYEIHIVFCALNLLFVVWFGSISAARWQEAGLFSIVSILAMVALGFAARHGLVLLHYSTMARSGLSVNWAVYASDVLEYASTVGLTATLLVISKGWMVSRYQLKRKTKILQGLTTMLLCAIYAIIVVVEITARDPANTYNTYETTTARVLAVVRVLLLGWFVWCVKRSYHQEDRPRVRRFYVHFGLLGAFWLGSLPVYSLIISALPSWYRLKTISALHFCTNVFTLFTLGTHMPVLSGLSVLLSPDAPAPPGAVAVITGRGTHVGPAADRARDSSRQEPRIPGNSGSRSVAPVTIPAPAAAPAPAKVELTPSGSSRGVNNGSQSARAMRDDEARAAEASRRADRREDMPTGHVGAQGPPGYPQAQQGQRQQLPPLAPAGSALGASALPPLEPIQGPSRCARIHTPSSTNFDTVH